MAELFKDFSIGLFFYQSIIFLTLLFLLRKFAWKPILNAVNEREKNIANALEAAEKAKEEMANLQSRNEELLKEAREERDIILKEARKIKDNIINEAKDEAQTQADKIIADAKSNIDQEKKAALQELRKQVADLSLDIAEKVVKEKLSDDNKQKELIGEMVKEVTLN